MSGLPNGKISDEEMDELVKLFRAGHAAAPVPSTPDERIRAGLAVALVASGYRREADVLREHADRRHCIDRSRLPMTVFGGVQIPYCICGMPWYENGCTPRQQLVLDAAERDRATALEAAPPHPVAAGSEVESLEAVEPEGERQ